MAHEFHKILSDKAETPIESREIKSLSSTFTFSPESIGDSSGSCRPFVNDRLNSRLAQTLPAGDWAVRCSAPLNAGLRPKHILHSSDRIVLQGDGAWQLFDNECQSLASGSLYGSDVFLYAAENLFFFSNAAGMIEARRLADGNRVFSASLLFGQSYRRSFIARNRNQMIVVSTERQMGRESTVRPEKSTIEVLKFDEPQKIDQDGVLRSSKVAVELMRKTLLLRAALHNETLVVATDDQICLLDLELRIKAALNGEFTPFVMSLDNAGIIYLVIYDKGVPKLRAVKPDGERIFSAELPEKMLNIFHPPIITYDHRVYLIKDNYLMAFSANGRCIWEYRAGSPIAGAVVTADNQLLISDGAEIGVFETDGHFKTLYKFKDELLQTPPTVTDSGQLVTATDKELYCLETPGS